ncbi:hypothetical protein Scep_000122 [Stephania cephalantha]|uniref:SSD domain-containing protein n=1 Tax=Stephania cephalantha TaxID=152367 RepID=A0AAP0L5S7_9MAGN
MELRHAKLHFSRSAFMAIPLFQLFSLTAFVALIESVLLFRGKFMFLCEIGSIGDWELFGSDGLLHLVRVLVIIAVSIVGAESANSRSLLATSSSSGYASSFSVGVGKKVLLKWTSPGKIHAGEYCSMYDICGKRSDGRVLNCPYGSPSVKWFLSGIASLAADMYADFGLSQFTSQLQNCHAPPDELLSSKIQSLCPTISGNVCCTEFQFETLRSQVQQAVPILVSCPACLRNFLNLFCELSCSPNQSQFINVTSVSKVNNNLTVGGIDYYITDAFGEELYNSCKDVKFGTMNTRAMDFVGAGAKNFKEWFAFIGREAEPGVPGSPYAINFRSSMPESSGMKPMNVSAYSCGDTSLGCSCGDCPSSPTCSGSAPPSPHKKHSCTIKMGSLKVKCIEFSLAILYGIVVLLFFGWSLFHKRKRLPASRMKPLLNVTEGSEVHSFNKQKSESQPIQIQGEAPRAMQGLQLSLVQGYISSFYRRYGTWVARNPTRVLCSSLAIVLLLCLGLIRFKVETRPEKLWVGHGSKAGAEKRFFDSHLAPFYRIEQLILATIPDTKNGKVPSIVTEENIQLLFEIQKKVDGIRANYSGKMVSLTDICLKPLGKDCATQSVLQYFKMDPDNFDSYGGVDHAVYCFQASAFVVTYPVNNKNDETGNENAAAVAWEKAFIQLIKGEVVPMVQSRNLTLSFSSENSIQEELKRESTADVVTILVLLGFSGVVVVMLSVLGSVGFFSAIALAVLLDFLLQVTAFVALIVFDFLRAEDHRVDCFPCIKIPVSSSESDKGNGRGEPGLLTRYMKVTNVTLHMLDTSLIDEIRISVSYLRFTTILKAVAEVHAPILDLWVVKLAVVAVFIAFAFASIALCTRIEPGLEQKVVLPRDSYLQGYFNNVSEHLRIGPPLYFVVKNYNYSSKSRNTNQLCSISKCDSNSLLNEIAKASLSPESSYIAKPAASWLDDFLVWMSPEAFGCCRKFTNGSYCPPDDQYSGNICLHLIKDLHMKVNPDQNAHFSFVRSKILVQRPPQSLPPPCCSPDEGVCDLGGVCKDCTTCFRHSDLQDDRPTTEQFREKLPWFLNSLPSADCAKGGHGAYTTSVDLNGYESGIIQASEFRTFHTPLNKQSDFVSSMRAARDFSSRVSASLEIDVFPYAMFYIFFEQYLDIWRTALINLAIALGAVFIVCLVITCSLWSSAIILVVLTMIVVDLMGVMAILNIQLNAVSVVNLVMSIGIAVEFCVHITHAFTVSSGDRGQRAKEALSTMGASVFSGITLTKLVGVIVLRFAKSEVFVVYYFQMYLALVLIGFLHGLVFLPVILSLFGPPSRYKLTEKQEGQASSSSSQLH